MTYQKKADPNVQEMSMRSDVPLKIRLAIEYLETTAIPQFRPIIQQLWEPFNDALVRSDKRALDELWNEISLGLADLDSDSQKEVTEKFRENKIALDFKVFDKKALKILEKGGIKNRREYDLLRSFIERYSSDLTAENTEMLARAEAMLLSFKDRSDQ